MVNAIGLNVGKKRKGSEDDGMALKRVQKKKELLVETDGDVLSAKNDGKGGEENSNIGSLLQSIEKNIGAFDEGKSEERNGKGNLSRERKRSKYLSPPFTIPIRGQREVYIEPESLKVSRKAKVSQRSAGADGLSSLPMYKGRSSLYSQGSLCELYKKNQPGRKRKMLESEEDGMLKELNLSTDEHLSSLKQNYGPKKRRKETASGKKGNEENAAGAVLFVSFWPGFSMPSRSDLVSVFSKFGALNEAETNMFRTNYTARVSFLRTSDAQKAYNHSQNNNPFGSPVDVTFQLLHSSDVCCCSYSVLSRPWVLLCYSPLTDLYLKLVSKQLTAENAL
ncbi:hypothetical protein JHK87_048073 [Glycine soja]|nr:hypothetical protein JHK87_048073 [Glycine soja]